MIKFFAENCLSGLGIVMKELEEIRFDDETLPLKKLLLKFWPGSFITSRYLRVFSEKI